MEMENVEKIYFRKLPVVMTFRCSEHDREIIKIRAVETGHSLSTYMRNRAKGGRTSAPIQDSKDLGELRQHMGLLKQLVKNNSEIRPLIKSIEFLIAKMTEKVG